MRVQTDYLSQVQGIEQYKNNQAMQQNPNRLQSKADAGADLTLGQQARQIPPGANTARSGLAAAAQGATADKAMNTTAQAGRDALNYDPNREKAANDLQTTTRKLREEEQRQRLIANAGRGKVLPPPKPVQPIMTGAAQLQTGAAGAVKPQDDSSGAIASGTMKAGAGGVTKGLRVDIMA